MTNREKRGLTCRKDIQARECKTEYQEPQGGILPSALTAALRTKGKQKQSEVHGTSVVCLRYSRCFACESK